MAGVDQGKVDDLLKRAQREIDQGLLPSCQLALAQQGEVVAFETFGQATNTNRYVVFSCTKPMVAAAAWLLIGEGALDVSRRAAEFVPEFGTNGKEDITVEQVLLHTAGFPRAPMGHPDWCTRHDRLRRFSEWRLNWEPGTRYEYHPTSAHWVLAEIIERLAGMDYRDVVNEEVLAAVGAEGVRLGIPVDEQDGIAPLAVTGEPVSPDELEAVFGVRELPVTEVTDEALLRFNDPEVRSVGVPGGGAVGTAAGVALFYQGLLHNPGGLWDPAVLADATSRVRNTFPDPLTGVPANRAIGVVVAGDDGLAARRMSFGHTGSPLMFGHDGAGGQVAWADPVTGLSFCYLTNGLDANVIRQGRRGAGLSSRAAICTAADLGADR